MKKKEKKPDYYAALCTVLDLIKKNFPQVSELLPPSMPEQYKERPLNGFIELLLHSYLLMECIPSMQSGERDSTNSLGVLFTEKNGTGQQGSDFFRNAQSNIFVGSISNDKIWSWRKELAGIPPSVSIILAVQDYDNTIVYQNLCNFFGLNKHEWDWRRKAFSEGVEYIKKERDVDVIFMDVFNPIAYHAVDYANNTYYSAIEARHYLMPTANSDKKVQYFGHVVKPSSDYYKYYLSQIQLIISTRGALSKGIYTR